MKKQIRSLQLLLALVAGVTAACTSSLKGQTSWDFDYSGSIVQWTAPQTGSYEITAYGAQGGNYSSYTGGYGAVVSGTFQFNAGVVLNILVGAQGSAGNQLTYGGGVNYIGASGGGGSFVVGPNNNTTPLLVAGGGGGVSGFCTGASDASTSTTGNNATGTDKLSQEGSGGTGGNGGGVGSIGSGGGGGGGFSGTGAASSHGGQGGLSYLNGAAGGSGYTTGGFGGGGGGGVSILSMGTDGPYCSPPGGGGGYSGGGGSGGSSTQNAKGQTLSGGGGGSYLASSALDTSMYVGNSGNGLVTIALASSATTPSLTFAQPRYNFSYSSRVFLLQAYSESPGDITFSSGDSSVVSIAGNTATIVGVGQATITATVATAPGYTTSSSSVQVIVNRSTPSVQLSSPSSIAFSKGKSFVLKTATSSDGAVTFTSSNPSVIVINGSKATLLKKGTVTITATVASTANYTSATGTQTVIVK